VRSALLPAASHRPAWWLAGARFGAAVVLAVAALSLASTRHGPEPARARAGSAQAAAAGVPAQTREARVERAYAKLPLRFERNQGQTDRQVRFLARGGGYSLFLTPGEAVLSLSGRAPPGRAGLRAGAVSQRGERNKSATVRMRLAGANRTPEMVGQQRLEAKTNYLTGGDPKRWRTGVGGYARVRYKAVYPGIDLLYYGRQGRLEHDFVLRPGADPERIAVDFRGAKKLTIDRRGALNIHTAAGVVRQPRPLVYQRVGSKRRRVAGGYKLSSRHRRVGFEIGAYDRTKPLVIDPVLTYSTYLGGAADDVGDGIGVDSAGNAYVTGETSSPLFPVKDAVQGRYGGGSRDAFVAKLDRSGSAGYVTYLGGSGDERGSGIAVDSAGNAYVAGVTSSSDFPTTPGAYKETGAGAFVVKLNPQGSKLVYSTLLGSALAVGGVAIDASGNAYLAGQTNSRTFPTKNAYQPTLSSGGSHAFLSKLNPAGSDLAYSTYLGGTSTDSATAVAADDSGGAYLTGFTYSSDFPKRGILGEQTAYGGAGDAFVTKLDTTAQGDGSLAYSTYLGGSAADFGYGIAVASGRAYVTGSTQSSGFPTHDAYQATKSEGECYDPRVPLNPNVFEPCANAFVSRIAAQGSALEYSTFLGGSQAARRAPALADCRHKDCSPGLTVASGCAQEACNRGQDFGYGIAVDSGGNAYVAGRTASANFPTKGAQVSSYGAGDCRSVQFASQYRPPAPCTDAFVVKLDTGVAGDASLMYSTYLGGNRDEVANAVAVDGSGNAYVTGSTDSNDFPMVDPLQADRGGQQPFGDAFVAKIGEQGPAGPVVKGLSPRGGPTAGGTGVTVTGEGLAGASSVRFGDTPAASFTVDSSGNRITAVSPPHEGAAVDVSVVTPSGTTSRTSGGRYYYGEGGWGTAGSLGQARRGGHTATLLPNGKVLVAGGCCDAAGKPSRSSELYDPLTGAWTPTVGELGTGRFDHTATLLTGPSCASNCGKVLVAGGYGPSFAPGGPDAPTNTAELFNPATGRWTYTTDMGSCVRLGTGGTSTTCGARYGHTATLLSGPATVCGANCGKVLVAGGYQASQSGFYLRPDRRPSLLYDPGTETWTPTGTFTGDGRAFHSATLISSDPYEVKDEPAVCGAACGKVLAVSGLNNLFQFPRPELYDPKSGAWTLTQTTAPGAAPPPTEQVPRLFHTATLLRSGKVLYAGGNPGQGAGGGTDSPTTSVELYDPLANAWSPSGQLRAPRFGHAAQLLPSGKVLAVGGFDGGPLRTAEVYDPVAARWRSAGAMTVPRAIADLGLPMDPGCDNTDAHPPRNYCGGGAEGQTVFSTPGPTATLLSSDPTSFGADQAKCGSECGKVLVVGGSSDPSAELYTPPPSISSISPATGPTAGGTVVTIKGTGFINELRSVNFGEAAVSCPSSSCTVDSYNQITVTSPRHAAGAVDVSVIDEGGGSEPSSASKFTYTGASEGGGSAAGGGSVTTPATGAAQVGGGQSVSPAVVGGGQSVSPAVDTVFGSEARRASGLRSCLAAVVSHAKRERRLARRGSARGRARARRHIKRHASSGRRRCLRLYGRTPGRVTGLGARVSSQTKIVLSFSAPGTDGSRPPAARRYVVKQSLGPIRDLRAFGRARTLCGGACGFPAIRVGAKLSLTITGLRRHTTYYYAVAARDNVSGRLGPRSLVVKVRTP